MKTRAIQVVLNIVQAIAILDVKVAVRKDVALHVRVVEVLALELVKVYVVS